MLLTLYVLMGFGVFLAAIFERGRLVWCVVAGALWPVVLWRVMVSRWYP